MTQVETNVDLVLQMADEYTALEKEHKQLREDFKGYQEVKGRLTREAQADRAKLRIENIDLKFEIKMWKILTTSLLAITVAAVIIMGVIN